MSTTNINLTTAESALEASIAVKNANDVNKYTTIYITVGNTAIEEAVKNGVLECSIPYSKFINEEITNDTVYLNLNSATELKNYIRSLFRSAGYTTTWNNNFLVVNWSNPAEVLL